MKKIALLLLLNFGINSSYANCVICAMNGMYFYPEKKEISMNSMFIIEGYAMSQETIKSFKNRKIFLESENGELIPLNLQEIHIGQMSLTQAILKPSSPLKALTTYSLKYSDQTEDESREMTRFNRHLKKHEKVKWKTTDNNYLKPLNSTLNIIYHSSEVIPYGCGPAVNANFIIKNKPESQIWFKTEFVNLTTNKKTTYYIKQWKDELSVGHGMCSGAFTYDGSGKYKVRFTAMNTDGNALKPTNWKIYDSPYKNAKSGF